MLLVHYASTAFPRRRVQRLLASDASMHRRYARLPPRHRLFASPTDVCRVVIGARSLGMHRAELSTHQPGPGLHAVPLRWTPVFMLRQVARKSLELLEAAQLRKFRPRQRIVAIFREAFLH